MSASHSLSGVATALVPATTSAHVREHGAAPAPAQPRARGFLHIVRYGAGPGSVYVLTYHRLERASNDAAAHANGQHANGNGHRHNGNGSPATDREGAAGVILSEAKDRSSIDTGADGPAESNGRFHDPDARPKPVVAEGAQALIDLLERIGVDFHRAEVRGALEDILRLGSANIPDLWLSDDDLLAKGLAES